MVRAFMEKLWFHDAVESLFSKGLKERVTPELKAQVRPYVDLDRPLLPAYSADAVEASLRIVGATLYPERSEHERLFALGPFAFSAFSETMIGKATVYALKLVGQKRGLDRLQRGIRSACNYVDGRVEVTGENTRRIVFTGAGSLAHFVAGLHRGVTDLLGFPTDAAHWRYEVTSDGTVHIDLTLS